METTEMRDFFNRVVDHVNQLTGTAERVSGLEADVRALSERVHTLEQENYSLRQELSEARRVTEQLRSEVDTHSDAARTANENVRALQDTIVLRDTSVHNLTDEVASERESHRITRADLEDARRAVQEWEASYNTKVEALSTVTRDRDEWHQKAMDYLRERDDVAEKFKRISSILNPSQPFPPFNVVRDDEQAAS